MLYIHNSSHLAFCNYYHHDIVDDDCLLLVSNSNYATKIYFFSFPTKEKEKF